MFYETMKSLGVGILIGVLLFIGQAIVWALLEHWRERRKERERIRRFMGVAVVGLLVLLLPACHSDEDKSTTGATAIATPTPRPSGSPSPGADPRCAPAFCEIQGDRIVFGVGPKQERALQLLVFDAFRTPIDNKCEFPRSVTWSHNGPIEPTGSRNSFAFTYYAITTGRATVNASVADAQRCTFEIAIEN